MLYGVHPASLTYRAPAQPSPQLAMIKQIVRIKRAWSVPRVVPHESLMVLSQSFMGLTTAGVSFDIVQLPGCSRSGNQPGKCR